MKTALILCTYNRPEYLKQCLESLKMANVLSQCLLIIVDDGSTDKETYRLTDDIKCLRIRENHKGICNSLLSGYEYAFGLGATFAMNLDSDSLVRNDFIHRMQELHTLFPNDIITGFDCRTKNKDGSERHVMIGGGEGYNFKKSVGGINMGMNKEVYEKHVKPVLEKCLREGGNWDHQASLSAGRVVSHQPSLVQHIGFNSAMGHNEPPDVSDNFKPLSLPHVTLVCVDDDYNSAVMAISKSTESIAFGSVKIITNKIDFGNSSFVIKIPRLGSKEAYSAFIINELYKYITTDFALIVQHDGYVKNWSAWTDEFLQYDYIGAPWEVKYSPYDVGNGGFSLRSLKLLKMTAAANWEITHPEDAVICRRRADELMVQGIRFAPREVADKFSFEGYNQYGSYTNQFGFHGERALKILSAPQYTGANTRQFVNMQKKQGLVFNQFLGLGDILFLVPMARHYMALGHDIVWPVADEYQPDLKRHFPDIQFVLKSGWGMDYGRRDTYDLRWQYGFYKVLPLRWNICRVQDCSDCMTSKYKMMGLDFNMWRGLKWERKLNKEFELAVTVGCTNEDECNDFIEYELHCNDFGCEVSTDGKKTRAVGNSGLPVIKMQTMKGFSMLDWALIIENATIIHAVSSSTLYMFETLNLKAKEIHLYGRNQGMKDHVFVTHLRTKNYILHP